MLNFVVYVYGLMILSVTERHILPAAQTYDVSKIHVKYVCFLRRIS